MENCELTATKTNFSHNKSLFPVWSAAASRPIPAVVMQYKCEKCGSTYKANDGRLLTLLPNHIREIYPVEPKYATGGFHLCNQLADELEYNMRTYANADAVSRRLRDKIYKSYTKKVGTYLSQNMLVTPFITDEEYVSKLLPPSGGSLRDLYDAVVRSPLTDYGYSTFERWVREMQSVLIEKNELLAVDWTFQVLKNYNLPAKCMFTMNKGSTKEIVLYAIVDSTAVSQVSHLLIQAMKKREKFKPFGIYIRTSHHTTHLFGKEFLVMICMFYWDCFISCSESRIL